MLKRLAASSILWPVGAAAHGPGEPVGPGDLAQAWSVDPWVLIPLTITCLLYGRGLMRLWTRAGWGRGVAPWRAACFGLGTASLACALVWPLDALGEVLFAAHMAQHMVLLVAAPPLLIAGLPLPVCIAGLPARCRSVAARALDSRALAAVAPLARLGPATAMKGVLLWAWHAPAAFEAALANEVVHRAEHICFLLAGLLFWWAVLFPDRRDALGPFKASGAVLITLIHSGMLGALIALAPVPLYASYAGRGVSWGLTQLQDQQLAGLVMWVPAGLAYLGAGVGLVGLSLARLSVRHAKPAVYPP